MSHRNQLTPLARGLRARSTDAERLIWSRLRNRQLGGCKFRRQLPAEGYVLDFACLERRVAVELDGGQHAEAIVADAHRTSKLEAAGWRVLRYWNDDVLLRTESVLEDILRALEQGAAPHPSPLPMQTAHGERESE